jgi:glycine/D-amino acid oxidase-like deaminating enzyme
MIASPDVITVGCGIADVSLAWFLPEPGMKATVFEREGPAAGGTGASAAIMRQHYSTRVMARLNAAGPWAPALACQAGIELKMRTVREQDTIWEALGGRPLSTCWISNAVDAIYVRPLGENRYVVGRGFPKPYADVDPHNYNHGRCQLHCRRVGAHGAAHPDVAGARLVHSYAALYDLSEDWYQYVCLRSARATPISTATAVPVSRRLRRSRSSWQQSLPVSRLRRTSLS